MSANFASYESNSRGNGFDIIAVLELKKRPQKERLVEALNEMAVANWRLRGRTSYVGGQWLIQEDPEIDLGEPVKEIELKVDTDPQATLERYIKAVSSQGFGGQMEEQQLIWRLHIVTFTKLPECHLVLHCSHALGDGVGLLNMLSCATEYKATRMSHSVSKVPPAGPQNAAMSLLLLIWGLLQAAYSVGRILTVPIRPGDRKTAFRLPKAAAGSAQSFRRTELPLSEVKRVARGLGVTVNSVIISVLAGAVRRYLDREAAAGHSLATGTLLHNAAAAAPTGGVRALSIVNRRTAANAAGALGIRMGYVFVPLNLKRCTSAKRAEQTSKFLSYVQRSVEVPISTKLPSLIRCFGCVPWKTVARLLQFTSEKTSMAISNMRGPEEPMVFAGEDVVNMYNFVKPGLFSCVYSAFSYGNRLNMCLASYDSNIAAQVLLDEVLAEFKELKVEMEATSPLARYGAL